MNAMEFWNRKCTLLHCIKVYLSYEIRVKEHKSYFGGKFPFTTDKSFESTNHIIIKCALTVLDLQGNKELLPVVAGTGHG